MARLINGSPMGELRGSIGAYTYSRNASGAFVRARVIPVNRQSQAQVSARANFSTIAQSYSLLPAENKAAWEAFAGLGFVSADPNKLSVAASTHRPKQAYTSLNMVAVSANRINNQTLPVVEAVSGVAPAIILVQTDIIPPFLPPPTSEVFTGRFAEKKVTVTNAVYNPSAGTVTVQLLSEEGVFNSPFVGVGLLVYASESLPFIGARAKSEKAMLIGSTSILTAPAIVTPTNAMTVTIANGVAAPGYINPPIAGQIRQYSVYTVNEFGESLKVGTFDSVVEA